MLLLITFNFFFLRSAFSSSLDELVYKLERDLKANKSSVVINEDVSCILKKKGELPVIYVPELNYLTGREIEKLPSTELSLFVRILKVIQPLKVYSLCGLVILAFFSVLFFFQQVKKFGYWVQVFVVAFLLLVFFLILEEKFLLLLFLFACSGVFLFSFKKWNFVYFYFGLLAVLGCCVVGEGFLERLINSPAEEFTVKVDRDWYAPDYLVEEAFGGFPIRAEIEKLTNRISWGNYTVAFRLRNLLKKVSNSEEKVVLLNDLGVISFMEGKLEKARKLFSEALREKRASIVEYNLFLTRSAMLDTSVNAGRLADKIRNIPLIAKGIPIPMHLYPSRVSFFSVLLPHLISVVLGLILGMLILKFIPINYGYFREDILKVPGTVSFINAEMKPFVVLPLFVAALNLLFGVLMCS
ncbi:hypothetical protein [Desulfurobacterium pacificum]|uniref:hypothetical protein n=1 Tax=Desulfurobacterium pacificum TaxID=240166 RepID=UPI0024B7BBC2|nr:hypothetical protein [Desulfurobacterium pacificum]